MGKAVHVNKSKLTADELKDYEKGWEDYSFNRYVSDMISLDRQLGDMRDPE